MGVDAISLDRLGDGAVAQVVAMTGFAVGEGPIREPHRHDYHELLWVRTGSGRQTLDGRGLDVVPGTVTIIGRGQVHVFEHARDLHGAVVRFSEEALPAAAGWLFTGRGGRVVTVPPGEAVHLEAAIAALGAELRRPPDPRTATLQRHLLGALVAWIERWWDASRIEAPEGDADDVALHRRFAALLERDFAAHHDAGWYAEALGVPAATLSRALSAATGRATKDLVLDRVLLEASRLLRFTTLGVGEVAWRVGYRDPLYFSRAFKKRFGLAPQAYREAMRGGSSMPS